MSIHTLPIRVYWEDTDAGGVVYHSNYLNFAERARTEFVRALGVKQRELAAQGFAFAVVRAEVDFHAPARLDDLLQVESRVEKVGAASVELVQTIIRLDDAMKLVRLTIRLGYIRLDGSGPARLPAEIRRALTDSLNERQK